MGLSLWDLSLLKNLRVFFFFFFRTFFCLYKQILGFVVKARRIILTAWFIFRFTQVIGVCVCVSHTLFQRACNFLFWSFQCWTFLQGNIGCAIHLATACLKSGTTAVCQAAGWCGSRARLKGWAPIICASDRASWSEQCAICSRIRPQHFIELQRTAESAGWGRLVAHSGARSWNRKNHVPIRLWNADSWAMGRGDRHSWRKGDVSSCSDTGSP